MRLATPERIQKLQRKLYRKAKREPAYRFYALYDKVHWPEMLAHAYALTRANYGAAGVDGIEFNDIESAGLERFLADLGEELREKRYRPDAVLRVKIPKADGGERLLGIPTIRDRVVQGAMKLVLEPIFEADFTDSAYGYRPGRSAQDAVRQVHESLKAGHTQVVDADLSRYFDTIPHSELLQCVARRVCDGAVLRLLKLWLKAPIEEHGRRGRSSRRGTGNRGTPQGGVLSPLLANIDMRRFLKAWEMRGYHLKYGRVVNYADDFVLLCRSQATRALTEARRLFAILGLALNEGKTRVCNAWEQPFDFLGYSFGVRYQFGSGGSYLAAYPADASVSRLKAKLRRMVGSHMSWISEEELVGEVNRVIRGWMNYFSYGTLWKTYSKLDKFVQARLRGWLVHKHRVGSRGECRYPVTYIYGTLGLVSPTGYLSQRARLRDETGPRAGCGKPARPVR